MSARDRISRAIGTLVLACVGRPWLVIALSAGLAAASLSYTVRGLGFLTTPLRLLPQHERYVTLLHEYLQDFGELNDIIVVVEAPAPDVAKAYAARLVTGVREALGAIRITYRIDPAYFTARALLYLSTDELVRLRDRLYDSQELLRGYAAHPTLDRLVAGLSRQVAGALVLGFFDVGLGTTASASDLRFLERLVDQLAASVDGEPPYVSPWAAAFSLSRFDDPDVGYFFSTDKRLLFLFVEPRRREGDFAENRSRIDGIRQAIARLGPAFPEVRAGVTGGPAIASDEMATAFADSRVATLLAFTLTLGLLVIAFRRIGQPLLLLVSLGTSLGWSLGLVTLLVGHLSVFSVMFISIVVGIGIDYGIYFLYRYGESLSSGTPAPVAIPRAGERAAPGMLLGALTAAGAFFVLGLTDFRGIQEFGVVSGIAVLMSFLSTITLLPALVAVVVRRRAPVAPAPRPDPARTVGVPWLARITAYRKTILGLTVVATAGAGWAALGVAFSSNMLKLQAEGVESVWWEQRILTTAGRSTFAALATAPDLEELRRRHEAFAALPSVARVESLLVAIPDRQATKMELIGELAPLVVPIRLGAPRRLDVADLQTQVDTLRRRLGLAAEGATGEGRGRVREALRRVDDLREKLAATDPGRAAARLERLQDAIRRDFASRLRAFRQSLAPRPISLQDLPAELKERYIGRSGRLLLRVHPAIDIWQRDGAERFIGDLRSVDPDVTGPPVTSFEAIRLIRQGYFQGAIYALVLVAAVTAAVLRGARATALALAPLALGVVWTLGLMRVVGLEWSLANVWALPLIIGTAAEFGLSMFLRFLEARDAGTEPLARSTVLAVLLCGLTTVAGFGSLLVAHHRGIFGLGLLLTVGATASLVASLVVLPVLVDVFGGASLGPVRLCTGPTTPPAESPTRL